MFSPPHEINSDASKFLCTFYSNIILSPASRCTYYTIPLPTIVRIFFYNMRIFNHSPSTCIFFRIFNYLFLLFSHLYRNFVYFLTHFRLFHEDFPCFFRQFARICSFSGFIFQNIALFCFKTTENICCYESNKTNVPLSQTIITYFYTKISKQ